MSDARELARWVREEREHGTPDAVLRASALRAGWSPETVDQVLSDAGEEMETGIEGPSRLSIIVAAVVLVIILVSVAAGWLMRTGRL